MKENELKNNKATQIINEEDEQYLYAETHKKNSINKLDSLLSYYIEQEDYKKFTYYLFGLKILQCTI